MIVPGGITYLVIGLIVGAIAVALVALAIRQWVRPSAYTTATKTPDGYQEAKVMVKSRYRPHTVRVVQDIPVRLRFVRLEDDRCSERVVFSTYAIDRRLPPFQESVVEFVPSETGTFLFTCEWGMYRGTLVVVPQQEARGAVAKGPAGRTTVPSAPLPYASALHADDENPEQSERL